MKAVISVIGNDRVGILARVSTVCAECSANILDVTVVKWHKAVGDPVAVGEVVAEVSSDKAAYEIESPVAGTLLAVLAPEKSIVPVKTILALVGAALAGALELSFGLGWGAVLSVAAVALCEAADLD